MKINLHTHSNYSLDGKLDVEELIKIFEKNNFDIISITDHDTCEAYKHIKEKPIDVTTVNEKVDQLKKIANNLFDEIDNKVREAQLAESAIVYANRDRAHQSDVHSRLTAMEKRFFDGEFESVYHDATNLFRNSHVD